MSLSGDGPVFGAVLDGRWDGHEGANGGFLLSLATRAVGEVLPFPDPLVVSGFYLRPGSPGPAEIRAEVIASQHARRTVDSALRKGRHVPWDFQPLDDASNQYMRNHLDLNEVESSRRFPR